MKSTRVAGVGLGLGVLSVLVISTELTFRALGLGAPVLYATNASYRYAPRPGQRMQRRAGAWVTIDSHGLRGTRDWGSPADLHILFIGDSVTWGGTSIDDRDTFAEKVCEILERQCRVRAVCGNAGVNAYGTDNMAARLQLDPVTQADVIVVTILADDTVRGLTDLRSLPYFSKRPPGPIRASWEVTALALDWVRASMRYEPRPKRGGEDRSVARRSLELLFRRLHELRAAGPEIAIVHSPALPCFDDSCPFQDYVDRLIEESRLPVIPVSPALRDAGPRSAYLDDVHLSEKGHELYAAEIARHIEREGIVARRAPSSPESGGG